jgi:exosome complex component RRP43
MANGPAAPPPGLSFPRATFAKLTPGPFLHAHLKQPTPIRPSGRQLNDFRRPTINTGSLTHSNGSAVIRLGDTAVVCGVRGEILKASDVPNPPSDATHEDDLVEELGLLVPNLELSTGCSPDHLPGNAPSGLAQSLSWRLRALLLASNLVRPGDLAIEYTEPRTDEGPDEEAPVVTKAYWTLYIDILCISLDGNCFDAAWIAVMAALKSTSLPKAWWDADREAIVCSPLASESHRLSLAGSPVTATFAVFSTASPLKQRSEGESWILADPDAFEEGVCRESLTIAIDDKKVISIEKHGGVHLGKKAIRSCIGLASKRWAEVNASGGDV